MSTVYLGIGSNIGDKEENCKEAVRRLSQINDIQIKQQSPLYLTRPAGGPPQEDYINGVIEIRTKILPEDLLAIVKDIEKGMGRVPAEERDHPRIIDIDILFYDDIILNSEELIIPHPRIHERDFVLHGLSKIAPETIHPLRRKTIRELYEDHKNDQ